MRSIQMHLFFNRFSFTPVREVMVPSMHWLLLLWGLQGLLAQDYEEGDEEPAVTPKKKNKIYSSNFIPPNGKCKFFVSRISKKTRVYFFSFPLIL